MEKRTYKLCNEFINCNQPKCPAYNNTQNDACWMIIGTLCRDRNTGTTHPKSQDDKATKCFGTCIYFKARNKLKNVGADVLKHTNLSSILTT